MKLKARPQHISKLKTCYLSLTLNLNVHLLLPRLSEIKCHARKGFDAIQLWFLDDKNMQKNKGLEKSQ